MTAQSVLCKDWNFTYMPFIGPRSSSYLRSSWVEVNSSFRPACLPWLLGPLELWHIRTSFDRSEWWVLVGRFTWCKLGWLDPSARPCSSAEKEHVWCTLWFPLAWCRAMPAVCAFPVLQERDISTVNTLQFGSAFIFLRHHPIACILIRNVVIRSQWPAKYFREILFFLHKDQAASHTPLKCVLQLGAWGRRKPFSPLVNPAVKWDTLKTRCCDWAKVSRINCQISIIKNVYSRWI